MVDQEIDSSIKVESTFFVIMRNFDGGVLST